MCLGINTTNRVEGTFGSIKREVAREFSLAKTLFEVNEWYQNKE